MKEERKQALLAEFGPIEGQKIVEEELSIEEHCKTYNITEHYITEGGYCNMGCC